MRAGYCLRILLGFATLGAAVPQLPAVQTAAASPSPQATSTGSVTGTVLAQDTQKPIRFAQVQLQSVASVSGASSGNSFGGFRGGGSRTDVDGTFTASNIAPGDYYVTASAVGFIPERLLLEAAVSGGSDPAQLLASLPIVHVDANETSSVTVTLQRGGALSGRVTWEDGSAAAGLPVNATLATQTTTQLPAPLSGLSFGGYNQFSMTDDRGMFRISGLPTGDYLLTTTIQSRPQFGGGRGGFVISALRSYAPGVFRKSAAKSYSVQVGEERTDVLLNLDLRSLRTVSGHATSSNPDLSVASGRVTITDTSDSSLVLRGSIDSDGEFAVRYVPPGNYVLAISGASTQAFQGYRRGGSDNTPSAPAVSFQPFSQAIVVTDTDISGFAATLTPVQSK
ncbi:hypothetical protein GOB94_08505 [Granulicella sp. 5B5]|uniref:MSCRAMM family protein n=1 Tax=Granulicella sp. 5B5 TaxID=1617967 RepID=UPI0015F7437B|nr:carboxypeptidase-like regulatory domain-containing protein [Granulicella sp. 5B5]QMV18716.1 hypothetical protein GOB94_08505 [Granulicella sp. 5B5]